MRSMLVLLVTLVLCFGPDCPIPTDVAGDGSSGSTDRSIIASGTYSGAAQSHVVETLDGVTVIDTTSDLVYQSIFNAAGQLMSLDGNTAIYVGFSETYQDATSRMDITYTQVSSTPDRLEVVGDITVTMTEGQAQRVLTGTNGRLFTPNADGSLDVIEAMDLSATTADGYVFRTQDTTGTLSLQ